LVKDEAQVSEPNSTEYLDFASGTKNSTLTPGGPGQLTGHRLKFDTSDPQQGIFFVAGDSSETQVSVVMRNKPAELMFIVPESLAAGDYALEVRASMSDGGEVRSGALRHTLTVT
jgi:hypothetical protein